MDTLFIIRNQNNQFLTRKNDWVDGSEAQALFKTPHHDIALNQLIEINTKHIDLRCELVKCQPNEKGIPVIPTLEAFADTAPNFPIFHHEPQEEDSLSSNDTATDFASTDSPVENCDTESESAKDTLGANNNDANYGIAHDLVDHTSSLPPTENEQSLGMTN